MGDFVLLLFCYVCKSKSGIFVSNEDGIISESSVTGFLSCDFSFECTFEKVDLTVDNEGDDALESSSS